MNAASRTIILYSVGILSVFTAGIFFAQRYDRTDKNKLFIHDIRRRGDRAQGYFSYFILHTVHFCILGPFTLSPFKHSTFIHDRPLSNLSTVQFLLDPIISEIFQKPYLLVIDTSRIIQYKPASHVFMQFDFDKRFSPNSFEKFLSNNEVQRFYSCALHECSFSSGRFLYL